MGEILKIYKFREFSKIIQKREKQYFIKCIEYFVNIVNVRLAKNRVFVGDAYNFSRDFDFSYSIIEKKI